MAVLHEVEAVLRERRVSAPEGSYSATLLHDPERAARKISEEAFEVCVELLRGGADGRPDPKRTASEAADLIFHLLAGLVGAEVPLDAVLEELARRRRGER